MKRPVVRLFGPLSVEDGQRTLGPRDFGGSRPKQVLEILLAARGHRVPTERLAELLWSDALPQNAAGSLQTFVSALRRRLASDRERARELVVTEQEAYRFATELVALDLDRFDELLERSAHEPTHAARVSLEEALALVRGEVLEDEPYATWAADLRGSYEGRILGARLDAADAALAELDFAPALVHAEAAIVLDGFSERAHRTQMLALYALGRNHEALDRYRSFRLRLDSELGLEPTAETRSLEAAVIRQEDVHALLPRPLRSGRAAVTGRVRLLGRDSELEALADGVGRAVGGGVALIHIEGETGFGKTRLLEELHSVLDGVRVGRATCSALERHLPYVPLAAALRDALDVGELESERLPALTQVLPELALEAPGRIFDDVEVLEALVALLAQNAPLVLLLDDVHWADPQTLAALSYLRRRAETLATAVVTAARPEEDRPGSAPRQLQPDTIVHLSPLSRDDLAAGGVAELHEPTGGNPRFVADALSTGQPTCPSRTLAEALLAQCRAEGPWAYRVIVGASMLEQPFDPGLLAELLEVEETELVEELERLCERRILRIDGFRFRFRYDVVRLVVLESVSPARQRLLRRRLESLGAEPTPFSIGRVAGSEAR
jgi:DNA-binding SARP family transcriptional activator